ncbi:DUF1761 domain-containing protein [Vannielia litorea]|uniref:DUF1761 domain-containing protein n=1 Tax=Vannielia litorea TaxID=1217970 RepID=UPI001BCFA07C|nr:DUF1761 domain-containing protein [Vannielia litorea]MBS8224857.1 DUF1761 domain-containing protein [Vannielia litorea]
MGLIAVLVAALAGFAVGAAWYMTLSRPWLAAAEIPCDDSGQPEGGFSPLPFIISGIAMLLVAGMMRHILAMAGIEGAGKSAMVGLGIGLFMITPWVAMNYAYGRRKPALTLLDGAYSVLGPTVIGLVLGLF